jgi:hypothetical protein
MKSFLTGKFLSQVFVHVFEMEQKGGSGWGFHLSKGTSSEDRIRMHEYRHSDFTDDTKTIFQLFSSKNDTKTQGTLQHIQGL